MILLAIDPGPESSACVTYNGSLLAHQEMDNRAILEAISDDPWKFHRWIKRCVIEKVVSYGMGVGAEVFETVYWSGIFAQAFGLERVDRIPRLDVKLHLCKSPRATDSNIRIALLDRFGGPQSARKGGPLYKVGQHERAALALAITWWEQRYGEATIQEPVRTSEVVTI